MASILAQLRRRATGSGATIVLAEGDDPRVVSAAIEAGELGLCRPVVVGARDRIEAVAAAAGVPVPSAIVDPTDPPPGGAPRGEPAAGDADRLRHALEMVRSGAADGAVMGAVATTAETLRSALEVVGVDPRFTIATSCFLMELADRPPLVYADCGVVPQPTAAQLAEIATQAAELYRLLVGEAPRVALLSFSTHGSARHPTLEPVRQAVELLRQRGVDFAFDGELQADAALVPEVASHKAPGSAVAGRANVLVFPDLNSGNIAYKLTERLAGARAIGPLLRGFRKPVHDLSRGCTTADIVDTMTIAAIEARTGATVDGR